MNLFDLLRADGSITVNKKLAHEIGLNEAVVYSELVSLYIYWRDRNELTEDGWFFCTAANLEKNTTLKEKTLQRATNKLVKIGLIEKKKKGLPSKTHYKITNAIYSLFSDMPNKNGQIVRTDNSVVSEFKNSVNSDSKQSGQIDRTREDKMSDTERSNCPTNNTKVNNTNLIKEEEEEYKEIAYSALIKFLVDKKMEKKEIKKILLELENQNLNFFTMSEINYQYDFMMDKLENQNGALHTNFASYFVYGLDMRINQKKLTQKHLFEKLEEQKLRTQNKRDTSFYYNWLDETGDN